jgi:hypothetical protein
MNDGRQLRRKRVAVQGWGVFLRAKKVGEQAFGRH